MRKLHYQCEVCKKYKGHEKHAVAAQKVAIRSLGTAFYSEHVTSCK